VVNQQRTYDFFGLEWRLPLWDREYCQFWCEPPVEMKLNQALYRKYLRRWDYRGLFTDPKLDKPIVRWPGLSKGAIPLARMAGLAGGAAAKDFVYDRLKYFGHYANQLGCYSYGYYLRRAGDMRNSVSLFAETWLREHFPQWAAEHLPVGA
jgi:asparagine synthase (glutamine-hydrolysing)